MKSSILEECSICRHLLQYRGVCNVWLQRTQKACNISEKCSNFLLPNPKNFKLKILTCIILSVIFSCLLNHCAGWVFVHAVKENLMSKAWKAGEIGKVILVSQNTFNEINNNYSLPNRVSQLDKTNQKSWLSTRRLELK